MEEDRFSKIEDQHTSYDLPEYQEASWQYADYFFAKDSSTMENIFTLVESVLPTPK
jgi:hypothetical protein